MDGANQDQGQVQSQVAPITQAPAPAPVSVPQKEQESVLVSSGGGTTEGIKPSEPELVIHPELTRVGVEQVSELPTLTAEQEEIGIRLAKEAVPVPQAPTGIVQLPMTEQEAKKVVRLHKKITESILWLARLVLRQVQIMHQKVASS